MQFSKQTLYPLLIIFIFYSSSANSQRDIKIVSSFTKNNTTIENTILINNDFIMFKNNDINIRLSKNNEILDIELNTIGVKWSGNLAGFTERYNEFCKIKTDFKYKTYDANIQKNRSILLNNNDAILINDSLVSYKNSFPTYIFTKTNITSKIIGYKAVRYDSQSDSNFIELFMGYKLTSIDLTTIKNLNIIIQKISSSIDKEYTINLNFLNSTNNLFPLKTVIYKSNKNIISQETVIALDKMEIDKSKCHPNNKYTSLSLFDLLQAAKNEIKL